MRTRDKRGIGERTRGRGRRGHVGAVVGSTHDGIVSGHEFREPLEVPPHDAQPAAQASTSTLPDPPPVTSSASWDMLGTQASSLASAPECERPLSPFASTSSSVPSPINHPAKYKAREECERPLPEANVMCVLNYGSEDDSDSDNENDGDALPPFVPKAECVFFEDEEDLAFPEQIPVLFARAPSYATDEPMSGDDERTARLELTAESNFRFEWRNLSTLSATPTERREVFSDINCGPTTPFITPYDAFTAIWDKDIMEHITAETNRYAQQVAERMWSLGLLKPTSRIANWQDTSVDELYVFFGMLLVMGMCVKSTLKDYWYQGNVWATPKIRDYMTLARFELLSGNLHFADNSTNLRTLSRPQAKLFKISPIINHLNNKFQSLYRLKRNIAIDESLTMWKGNMKQFLKNKALSSGIRTYEICESQTGYLWKFKVHAGKEVSELSEVTSVSGVIPTFVLDLLKGLEHKGHTVWMGNDFNSPVLARVLKSLGFDCVGPLKSNHQCVPVQLNTLRKEDMTVGQIYGQTSRDVDILVWRNLNREAMISTYHGASVHTSSDGKTKPVVKHDYKVCMGGVDKKNQMLSAFPIERKRAQVWYKTFFRRLLNVSVLNAYILYAQSLARFTTKMPKYSHREFREILIMDVFKRHKSLEFKRKWSSTALGSPRVLPPIAASLFTKEVIAHFPKMYGPRSEGSVRMRQRRCHLCPKVVPMWCPTCKVFLCLDCSPKYHQNKLIVP